MTNEIETLIDLTMPSKVTGQPYDSGDHAAMTGR